MVAQMNLFNERSMKKREFVFLDGGLGNQMFQYAFANKEEMEGNKVSCCYGLLEKRKTHNGYELERVFRGIKAKRMILATYIVRILYYLIYIYKTTYTKKSVELHLLGFYHE